MKAHLPTADELQYLVSTAAAGYLQQLNKMIPDVVNVAGQPCLPFHQFQFEIVQSHIQDKRQHQAMIHFHSEPLLWIDSLDHYLIFADGSQSEKYTSGQEIETDTLVFRLGLSIRKFQCYEN